jgi:prepilin-type processing-associated H-X9-DG protein
MENSQSKGQDNQAYLFGAAHSSVFNAAFADGSVRSIGYDIDMYVFNSAGTRNGEAFKETTSMAGID